MTKPRKTPRTDRAVDKHSFLDGSRELHPDIIPFIQALEIETQELADALLEILRIVDADGADESYDKAIAREAACALASAESAALAKHPDTERMDWLSRRNYGFPVSLSQHDLPAVITDHPSPYLRAAIDAARKQEGPTHD